MDEESDDKTLVPLSLFVEAFRCRILSFELFF